MAVGTTGIGSGYTHYCSTTTAHVPAYTDLGAGEIAVNTADRRLFTTEGLSLITLVPWYLSGTQLNLDMPVGTNALNVDATGKLTAVGKSSTVITSTSTTTTTANTAIYSAFARTFNTGDTIVNDYGLISEPVGTFADGTGTAFGIGGFYSVPQVASALVGSRVTVYGARLWAYRTSPSDVSTHAQNALYGAQIQAGLGSTVAGTATAASVVGVLTAAQIANGTATNAYGVQASATAQANSATSSAGTITNAYGLNASINTVASGAFLGSIGTGYGLFSGASIAAGTTVGTYYGLYLQSPAVSGTLTTRWGIYQQDSASPNYLAGHIGQGVTPSAWQSGKPALETTGGAFWGFSATSLFVMNNQYFDGTNFRAVAAGDVGYYALQGANHVWTLDVGPGAGVLFTPTTRMSLSRTGLAVTGTLTSSGGFGVNGASAQTAYASGGALAAYGAGANGFDTAGHASALYAMVVAIRAALVAIGIMS